MRFSGHQAYPGVAGTIQAVDRCKNGPQLATPIVTRDAITGRRDTSLRTIVISIATTLTVRYDCRLGAVINAVLEIGTVLITLLI